MNLRLWRVLILSALSAGAARAVEENVREAPPQPKQAAPQLTQPPALLESAPAVYPPERLARGETADVACLLDIAADGSVAAVALDPAAADAGKDFDAAALAALQKYRFSPAEIDHQPALVRIRYVYHFVLQKKRVAVEHPAEAPGSIRGLVLEGGTRKPIGGAAASIERSEIAADRSEIAAETSADGRFLLEDVPPGDLILIISAQGFAEKRIRVKLLPKASFEAPNFYLRRSQIGELSAIVSAEKSREAPTRRSLSHDELVNVPGSLNDPVRAVQNLPGMNRAPFLGGQLLVRGSPPGDTGTYLDGEKIPQLYHFLGGPSVINEELLDRIDFYPGGFGSYYGRNLAGAIDVGTRKGDATGLHGSFSADLLELVGFIEGPLGPNTSGAIAARRSHLDLFLPLFIPNNKANGTTVITPIYYDYQARLDHKLGNGDELSVLAFGSDDKLDVLQKGGKRVIPLVVDSHVGFNHFSATWKHAISDSLNLRLTPAFGLDRQSFSSSGVGQGTYAQGQAGSLNDTSLGLRSELRWQAASFLRLRAGTDLLFDRYTINADIQSALNLRNLGIPITQETIISKLQPFSQLGEYLEGEYRTGPFSITPGLRLDQIHWREHTRASFDPRLWVRAALTPQTALKTYIGLYHQPPTPLQVDDSIGNPDLELSWAAQAGAGVEHKFDEQWNLGLEGFYNRKGSLVFSAPAEVVDGQLVNPHVANHGRGRAYGVELLLRREITATLYGWVAYTLSKSEVLRNPDDQWVAFRYDQTHILTIVAGYRPAPGWEISSRYRLVSGNPTTPIVGSTFDADTGGYVPDQGRFGDARLPLFSQLDFHAQKTWTGDLIAVSLYLDVQNITNHRNEEIHIYDYRYRDQGSIPGIPILPTLGGKVRF